MPHTIVTPISSDNQVFPWSFQLVHHFLLVVLPEQMNAGEEFILKRNKHKLEKKIHKTEHEILENNFFLILSYGCCRLEYNKYNVQFLDNDSTSSSLF